MLCDNWNFTDCLLLIVNVDELQWQVGGYVVEYNGLTFVTVRGAGHTVPSYQPQRALTMISSFLQGTPLPF